MSTPTPATLPPALRLSQMIVSLWVPQAIHAAAELGLADVLDRPLPSAAVAERLGTHADATDRLMRALVTLGLLTHDGDGFALTELGGCLRTGVPASRRAWSRLMGGPHVWDSWGRLLECVRTGRKAYGGSGGSAEDVFAAMEDDPQGIAVFHQAMVDSTSGAAPGIARAIDFAGAREVVDVGGGGGNPVAQWFTSFSDLNMLVNTGGRERTREQYTALLQAAGFRVTAVREAPPSFFCVFESTRA